MIMDAQVAHSEDLGEKVGEFYGSSIRALSPDDVELREIHGAQIRARLSLGVEQPPIVLLPGEVLKGNLIRRMTTAEVVGETFYDQDKPDEIAGLQVPDFWDDYTARCA